MILNGSQRVEVERADLLGGEAELGGDVVHDLVHECALAWGPVASSLQKQ